MPFELSRTQKIIFWINGAVVAIVYGIIGYFLATAWF